MIFFQLVYWIFAVVVLFICFCRFTHFLFVCMFLSVWRLQHTRLFKYNHHHANNKQNDTEMVQGEIRDSVAHEKNKQKKGRCKSSSKEELTSQPRTEAILTEYAGVGGSMGAIKMIQQRGIRFMLY